MPLSQRKARLLKRLAVNRSRAREGLVLVEGVRAAGEALAAGASVSFALVSPRLDSTDEGGRLRARLERAAGTESGGEGHGFDVVRISDAEMTGVADTEQPQGVVLVCEEPALELGAALAGARRVLVLDAVQDPGNVGTLVRSAVAFSFDLLLALDGTTDPWGSKAVRASAGTVFRIAVVRCPAEEAVAALSSAGLSILVASAEGSAAVEPPEGGFALTVGNEGAGVRDLVRRAATATVAVPMTGPAESLNVGIAGSILMSDFTKADR